MALGVVEMTLAIRCALLGLCLACVVVEMVPDAIIVPFVAFVFGTGTGLCIAWVCFAWRDE